MELRPGYKKTEIGEIPEDWKISQLGELAEVSSGTTPARSLYGRYYKDGSVAWVKTLDLNNSHINATSEYVTKLAVEETSLRIFPVGTVLVAMYGGFQQIGRTGLLRLPATVNQALSAIQLDDKLAPAYVLSVLNYRVSYWREVASSSRKDPNITGHDVRVFPLAYPSRHEQEAIAEALSDVDASIAAQTRLIAKKRDLRQGAMQRLLTGQTRLPGFTTLWQTKTLGEIGEVSGAGVDKKSRPGEISVRLVNYMDVYRSDAICSSILSHAVTAKETQARRCSILSGDVFFTPTSETRDDIAHSAVAVEDITDAVYSYHLVRLRLNEPWDIRFRGYAFKTNAFMEQASVASEGSGTRYVITLPKFRALTVSYPSDSTEQAAIARILSDIDAEIAALETRLEKTRALKRAMMQALLTGRVRLLLRSDAAPQTKKAAHV